MSTDMIDQKTGGKHSDKLKKVDDAAQKYAGTAPASSDAPAAGTDPDGGDTEHSTT